MWRTLQSCTQALLLIGALGLFNTTPAWANCDAAKNSCSSSCNSQATSGFIVGLAGALKGNNSAYQSGQRDMQSAQACYERCQQQHQSCSRQEQAVQQRQEAQRRAQQEQIEAQKQRAAAEREAQQRAQAEREALRQRVNRVISPPALPASRIKDAAALLLEAQAHEKDGNPAAAAYIYKLVVQTAEQPRQQQSARAALKRQTLEALVEAAVHKPAIYAVTLDATESLGIFNPAERTHLAAMSPGVDLPENAAWEYLRKNPKGTLREVAQAVMTAAPGWREQLAEEQRRREAEGEEKRLQQIRTASRGSPIWVRTKEGCRIFDYIPQGTLDVTWSGHCQDGLASGPGSYRKLGANGVTLVHYEGSLIAGKLEGFAKVDYGINGIYEGEFRNGNLHGRGKYIWKNEGKRFEGDFRDNAMAQGTLWESSGRYFKGDFADNRPMNGTVYGPDGKSLWSLVNGEDR